MTKLAQLLLVLTSIAPIGIVFAGDLLWRSNFCDFAVVAGIVVSLVVLCLGLLLGVGAKVPATWKLISDPTTKEGEPLAFLVAYALPLIAGKPSDANHGGLAAFVLVMGLVLWQGQIFYVNPLLSFFGYHFFSARNDGGGQVLILTRSKTLVAGKLRIVRISEYFWLDRPGAEQAKGGLGGPTVGGGS